jgi:plasmid stabilization system protein ParE
MSYTIKLRLQTIADFEEACHWYRDKSIETEDKFKKAFRERLSDIAENPEAYGVRFEKGTYKVRAVNVKKFPYLIFYIVNNVQQTVRIIALWHDARDREKLKTRI